MMAACKAPAWLAAGDKALVPVSPVDGKVPVFVVVVVGKVPELRKSVDTKQSTAEAPVGTERSTEEVPVDTERQAAAVEGPDNTTELDNKMLAVWRKKPDEVGSAELVMEDKASTDDIGH